MSQPSVHGMAKGRVTNKSWRALARPMRDVTRRLSCRFRRGLYGLHPGAGSTPLSRGAQGCDCARLCRETLYAVLRCADISACFASAWAIWSPFHSGSRQRQK